MTSKYKSLREIPVRNVVGGADPTVNSQTIAEYLTEDGFGGGLESEGLYYRDSGGNVVAVPLFNNNVTAISPDYLIQNQSNTVTVTGENFLSITSFDFGENATINSETATSPTSATVDVTPTVLEIISVGANVEGDASGSTFDIPVYSAVFVPGDGTTTWDNQVGAITVGEGTFSATGGSLWNRGATFASVSAGSDFELFFDVHSISTQKSIFGLVTSYVDENWTDTQYGVYFGATALSITVVENGGVGASLGTYVTGDTFSIQRVGTTMTLKRNGSVIHTYADASSEPTLIAEVNVNSGADYRSISWRVS